MMVVTTAGVTTAGTIQQMLAWRMLGGIATGGIVPIALALLGDLFPYAERGRPIGWIFGAIAGGMAFGSTCGAILNPLIGWRITSLLVGCAMAIIFLLAFKHRRLLAGNRSDHLPHLRVILKDYATLL